MSKWQAVDFIVSSRLIGVILAAIRSGNMLVGTAVFLSASPTRARKPIVDQRAVAGSVESCRFDRFQSLNFPMAVISVVHYDDVIMTTRPTIVYSTVYLGADQRKHQISASLAFVRGIHRGPVNSRHKWSVTRKMFPFDDVIVSSRYCLLRGRYHDKPCARKTKTKEKQNT